VQALGLKYTKKALKAPGSYDKLDCFEKDANFSIKIFGFSRADIKVGIFLNYNYLFNSE